MTHQYQAHIGLHAQLKPLSEHDYQLTISTSLPAFYVVISGTDYRLSDNYFHVMPGFNRTIMLSHAKLSQAPMIKIRALNSASYGTINRESS